MMEIDPEECDLWCNRKFLSFHSTKIQETNWYSLTDSKPSSSPSPPLTRTSPWFTNRHWIINSVLQDQSDRLLSESEFILSLQGKSSLPQFLWCIAVLSLSFHSSDDSLSGQFHDKPLDVLLDLIRSYASARDQRDRDLAERLLHGFSGDWTFIRESGFRAEECRLGNEEFWLCPACSQTETILEFFKRYAFSPQEEPDFLKNNAERCSPSTLPWLRCICKLRDMRAKIRMARQRHIAHLAEIKGSTLVLQLFSSNDEIFSLRQTSGQIIGDLPNTGTIDCFLRNLSVLKVCVHCEEQDAKFTASLRSKLHAGKLRVVFGEKLVQLTTPLSALGLSRSITHSIGKRSKYLTFIEELYTDRNRTHIK